MASSVPRTDAIGLRDRPDGGSSTSQSSLVHRRLDAWAAGWLAVLVWGVVMVADQRDLRIPVGDAVIWAAAFTGATHFAMSYRLAYHRGSASVRAHPMALAFAPLAMVLVLMGLMAATLAGSTATADLVRSSVTVVFALTMWHYIKQVYGVMRIGASFAGFSLSAREVLLLRYSLYPLWALSLWSYFAGRTIADVNGFEVRADLLPTGGAWLRNILVFVTLAGLVAAFVSAGRRQRALPPALMLAPCVAGVLWVGFTPNVLFAVVILPAFHAIQYLACCYPAQHGLNHAAVPPTRHDQSQLAQIFLAAGCAGLLATRFLPNLLDSIAEPAAEPGLWLLVVFVFLNLHHYLIDATIWRSKGELVGLIVGSDSPR